MWTHFPSTPSAARTQWWGDVCEACVTQGAREMRQACFSSFSVCIVRKLFTKGFLGTSQEIKYTNENGMLVYSLKLILFHADDAAVWVTERT